MKNLITKAMAVGALTLAGSFASAAPIEYKFDVEGSHTFIQFKAKHLGISWLYGRFNKFDGSFVFDPENDANNKVSATVDINSLDSNHAERDVHLRNDKFLDVSKFKMASFESTKYETISEEKAKLTGDLTLMGVTKTITLDVDVMGQTIAPWEQGKNLQRRGFEAKTWLNPADYGMKSTWVGDVELIVSVEGIGPLK